MGPPLRTQGGMSHGCIETTWDVKRVWKCNVLEDDEVELAVRDLGEKGKGVEIELRAFEVASFRLVL